MSITSETQICNNALLRIGADTITSLDDGTVASNIANQIYEPTRDALLRRHFWNFAIRRTSLAENATAPDFEWDAQYTLPSDFIRVKKLYNTSSDHQIEGEVILVNQSSELQLVYVSKITDVTRFDSLFVEALTLILAIKMSPRMNGTSVQINNLVGELNHVLLEAKIVDAQDSSAERLEIDTFINSRQSVDDWLNRPVT